MAFRRRVLGFILLLPRIAAANAAPIGGDWSLEVSGGRQQVKLGGYDRMMDAFFKNKREHFAKDLQWNGSAPTTDWSVASPGFGTTVDGTARRRIGRHAGLAFRVGALFGMSGAASFHGSGSKGETVEYVNDMDASLTTMMIGGWGGGGGDTGFRFMGSVFAGVARARARFSETQTYQGLMSPWGGSGTEGGDFDARESGGVFEVEAEFGYAFTRTVELFVAAAYRAARMDNFMQYPESSWNDSVVGDLLGQDLFDWFGGTRRSDWDFSGARALAGVRLGL